MEAMAPDVETVTLVSDRARQSADLAGLLQYSDLQAPARQFQAARQAGNAATQDDDCPLSLR